MADKTKTSWLSGKKTYCLITGASRGIGREIAKQFAANVGEDSILLLVARKTPLLETNRDEILAANPRVKISLATYDLGKPDVDNFKTIIEDSLSKNDAVPGDFQQVVVVHNAGAAITPRNAVDYGKYPTDLTENLVLNVISPVCLNSVFLEAFASVQEKLIVHITTKLSVAPFAGFSFFCTAHAARKMYFNTVATEDPKVTVIHYAPDGVETDMFHEIMEQLKETFPTMYETLQSIGDDGQMITCELAINKLVSILQEGNFESGIYMDYYGEEFYQTRFGMSK